MSNSAPNNQMIAITHPATLLTSYKPIPDLSSLYADGMNELDNHGLLSKGWTFSFDDAKQRMGCCKHHQKIVSISWPLIKRNPDQFRDTLLHEIAHALCGPSRDPHGPRWKLVARSIGCTGNRCGLVSTIHVPGKFLLCCPNGCFAPIERHRRTFKTMRCRTCRAVAYFMAK